jgi:predicted AlkP superfamily pyrophosphatase or phosphodiesterase
MKAKATVWTVAVLGWLGAASVGRAAESGYVVLITIDGFPARMFWDPKTPIPRIRELAAIGVTARELHVANPTVTWPNHTTLVTGMRPAGHGVLYNGLLVREGAGLPVKVDPQRDKSELVGVPTLYDELHQAGLRTAAIDWPCTRNSSSLDDDFPDTPDSLTYTTPRLRKELVTAGILNDEGDAVFQKLSSPQRDEVWTKAACHVIRARQPHLLLVHLLNTDGIHHQYGPESPASYTALALADFLVGQLLDALDTSGIRKKTTVFVLADHGFATATNVLHPNILLRQAGLISNDDVNKGSKARAMVVPEGGTGMLYLTDPQTREMDRKKVIELFKDKEGIQDILLRERFSSLGLPSPEKNPGMADLILVARDGYAISGTSIGEEFVAPVRGNVNRGYHGYIASDPNMNAPFIASGRGIKKGLTIGAVENIDVAPTIAHLLGHELHRAEGKVLSEILSGK